MLLAVHERCRQSLVAALVLFTFLSCFVTAPARADIPPQQPGVTLRVYDLQTGLDRLCTIKSGQTPNVDKLMPVINWTGTADFGISDMFVSEVTGNINIPTAGTYQFRLTSDDGSRLRIDGQVVINHDGLHGATPVTGSVQLTAGYHALRIDHFDNLADQQITLEWQPPGASSFAVVPNSVLSTDADVVRVTSPGRKECEGAADSPGDGLPLTGVHPGFTLTNLRPSGFQPQVTGMDWLPDGRLAIATWGGSNNVLGEVYLLSNVAGNTDPSRVQAKRVASDLKEPMGIKHVDGKLYVSEKHRLVELNDTNGDEVTDNYRTVATWPFGGNFHEFAFGLLYKGGYFYANLSVSINYGGATTDPQPAPNRGTTIKVNKATGEVSYIAGGLRTPHGIGWGPEGDIFVTDNQGGWLPANKLVRVKQNRFFNHYTNPAGPFDAQPVTAPVLWLPHNEIANSPSNLVMLPQGPFAGQLVYGDVTYGGLQRAFLEKVNGEYQGAVFRMTQGLESGVSRISLGPDGAIYTGGIDGGGNWGQPGKLAYGLQKITPNGTNTFDILSMRAVQGGFELQYTQPLSAETVQDLVTKYQVSQWRYVPTPAYGGPKVDEQTLRVSSATVSADRRKVTLQIPGLQAGRVVHVRSPRPFASESGTTLWSTEAWYTLNSLPGGPSASVTYEAERAALSGGAAVNTNHTGYEGTGFVDGYWNKGAATTFAVNVPSAGTYNVGLRFSNGPDPSPGAKSVSVYVNGTKVRQTRLASTTTWENWATQPEALTLNAGANSISYRFDDGDAGNVNLDNITVTAATRIPLFTGNKLDAWELKSGGAATWPVTAGSMETLGGDIRTKQKFGDFKLHVEWYEPNYPSNVTGQARGNSGVYLQERYELQVLDSYGDTSLANDEAGAIYSKKAPDVNAARAPLTWQTYDITFRAARFDSAGNKTDNARVTVVWNGVTVHNDVAIDGPTGGGDPESAAAGAIRLQDHGDPGENPRFRNIWIEPIS
ncbi:family 16 glycoside hydrolase [Kibdelosporangium persicum]|uniref:Cycloisomaltooligosaccharide glucanotransferase n=1 Tax=Kibdelosporangium persicum TaxID=2698649 RepID=A0ABX2F1J1_9PSEU|nr:family 16 glycoside hydrolase [Kibdelosporangium persicum]NRN65157.1 Cycloisomaltooligosaccharide glucanotransferase [Kibdelosporangium persicum]